MNRIFVALAVVALTALPAAAQSTVICESADGSYRECRLEGAGVATLTRQMSDRNCIEGQTWGYRDGKIWVDKGCRGQFAISRGRAGRLSAPPMFLAAHPTTTLVCESIDGRRNHCRADTNMGVLLTRQMSGSTCEYGVTWGIDQNGVWVTRGCRAEFMTRDSRIAGGMTSSAAAATVVCESENGERKHCRADTRYGVSMLRQLSDKRCEKNRTWGVDDAGVWVTNGCRAEFVLDRR
ncbi:MAG: DUF3011 domain-containing protein [Thermoanaerobaculia bacterium]